MTRLTNGELAVVQGGRVLTPRGLFCAVAPRVEVFAGQLNGTPPLDEDTLGLYQLGYDNVSFGSFSDAFRDMDIVFGTTPGASDLGTSRLREAPTSGVLYIAETSPGRLPVADNHYFSVKNNFRPALRLPRGQTTSSTGTYTDGITMFVDYGRTYVDDNGVFTPKANITRSSTSRKAPRPAGFVDGYGSLSPSSLRTLTLSAAFSLTMTDAGSISSVAWGLADGSITVGGINTTNITVEFPVGFRWISLSVFSGGKKGIRYYPIWVFDASHMPLANFAITRSIAGDYAETDLEFFAQNTSETTIPRGTPVCVFEHDPFWGDNIPDSYRDQTLGWVRETTTLFRRYQSRSTLTLGGVGKWMSFFREIPQRISDPLRTAASWFEMQNIYADKLAFYLMENFCTGNLLSNFYPSGITNRAKSLDLTSGAQFGSGGSSLLGQVQYAVQSYYGRARFDLLNNLTLFRHYSWLTDAQRAAIDPVIDLNARHWRDDNAPKITTRRYFVVASLLGAGASFDGAGVVNNNGNTIFNARAPGRTPEDSNTEQDAPGQILPYVADANTPTSVGGAQEELSRLTAAHFSYLNNERDNVPLEPLFNLDVVDPAENEPVSITTVDSESGLVLDHDLFMVKEVSITYDDPYGGQGKRMSWALEGITNASGSAQMVVVEADPTPPVDQQPPIDIPIPPVTPNPFPPAYNGALPTEGFVLSAAGPYAARATAFNPISGLITYVDRSSGLVGTGIWFYSNPYAYKQAFALTTYGLEYLSDQSNNAAVWTQLKTNLQLYGDAGKVGWIHRGAIWRNGWGMALSTDGTRSVTFNNWATCTYYTDVLLFDFNICGHDGGHLYGAGIDGSLYKSTDYGVTFVSVTDYVGPWPAGLPRRLHIPYMRSGGAANNDDGSLTGYQTFNFNFGGNQNGRIAVYPNGFASGAGFTWPGQSPAEDPSLSGLSAQQPATAFTYDAAYSAYCCAADSGSGRGLHIRRTTDFFATRTAIYDNGTVTPYVNSINGYPSNPAALLVFGKGDGVSAGGILQMTLDGLNFFGNAPSFFPGGASAAPVAYAEFSIWPAQG